MGCSECVSNAEHFTALGVEMGKSEERAAIVTWLRDIDTVTDESIEMGINPRLAHELVMILARRIEKGEHRK